MLGVVTIALSSFGFWMILSRKIEENWRKMRIVAVEDGYIESLLGVMNTSIKHSRGQNSESFTFWSTKHHCFDFDPD
jgi:hypothetical protein